MYPFTEGGVADLMTAMYALSDSQLHAQAIVARDDLKGWLLENLALDSDQQGYLDTIPSDWFENVGFFVSVALDNRRPITLIKPVVISPSDYSSKIIESDNKLSIKFNENMGMQVSGSLTFTVALPTP